MQRTKRRDADARPPETPPLRREHHALVGCSELPIWSPRNLSGACPNNRGRFPPAIFQKPGVSFARRAAKACLKSGRLPQFLHHLSSDLLPIRKSCQRKRRSKAKQSTRPKHSNTWCIKHSNANKQNRNQKKNAQLVPGRVALK